jgi:hypothetical protein
MSDPETDATAAPLTDRPKRPKHPGAFCSGVEAAGHAQALDCWCDAVLVFDEAEEARVLAAGQAVYDRIEEADRRAAGSQTGDKIRITPADFRDFQVWMRTYGIACFDLQPSMEFSWFSGSVLVVVR